MKKVNLCDYGDLLHHAVSMGFEWNDMHERLRPILNDYGMTHVYREYIGTEYYLDKDAERVLISFMDDHKVDYFQIPPKGG